MKRLIPYQRHPDSQLQAFWDGLQLAVLIMPFSSLLGSVAISLISLILLKLRFQSIAQRLLNRGFAVVSLLMILSAVLAYYRTEAFLGLANFLPFFIICAALSELIQTPAQLRRLAWILVSTSIPVVLIGLGEQFWGWTGHVQIFDSVVNWMIYPTGNPPGRMASIFFYANVLASYLVITFILSLGLLIEAIAGGQGAEGRKQQARELEGTSSLQVFRPAEARLPVLSSLSQRVFLFIAVVSNAIALILTDSRNVWAIALLACLAFALYLGWRWLLIGVALVAGGTFGAAFGPSPIREWLRAIVPSFFWLRLTDQLYPNRPLPVLRTSQWKFAWSLTQQRPLFGWGLRNFSPIYESQTHFFVGHPHNLLLMLTAEVGLPTTLLFFSLVGWAVFQGFSLLYNSKLRIPNSARSSLILSSSRSGKSTLYSRRDRLIYFTFLIAFLGCTLFSLLDITLFDVRINLFGWLLLSGICGLFYHRRQEAQG